MGRLERLQEQSELKWRCLLTSLPLSSVSSVFSLLEAAATTAAQARSVQRAPTRKFHLFKSSSKKTSRGEIFA